MKFFFKEKKKITDPLAVSGIEAKTLTQDYLLWWTSTNIFTIFFLA